MLDMWTAEMVPEHCEPNQVRALRFSYERRIGEFRNLFREGGPIDSLGPGCRAKVLVALAEEYPEVRERADEAAVASLRMMPLPLGPRD